MSGHLASVTRTSRDGSRPATKSKSKTRPQKEDIVKPCHISRLPVEILAEILSYIRVSDILAVARTSKYYCATLVQNPASTYIWKEARARFKPSPIPDPTPNFTEPSYAAFLFDKGICEICKDNTNEPLVSYSLRLRLCSRPSCRTQWRNRKAKMIYKPSYRLINLQTNQILATLLPLEKNNPLIDTASSEYYRLDDWLQHVDARNRALALPSTFAQFQHTVNMQVKRRKPTLELCQKLLDWRRSYDQAADKIRKANLATAARIALSEGWKTQDLHQCPSFALLYTSKTVDLTELTHEDLGRIKPWVQRELQGLYTEQQRYKDVKTFESRQEAVLKLYQRMKSQPGAIMPPLATFRKLPFVRRMAGSSSLPDVSEEIEHSKLVAQLAKDDVDEWIRNAKERLTDVLGFAPLNESSSASLAPVDRLTARFRCKKCASKLSWPSEGSMNFAEACAHECSHAGRPSRQKPWDATQFVPDSKAIDVVQQVLMWCGYTADDVLSLEAPDQIGTRIQCLSCPSHIVMTYDNLFSHCYRHESMQLRLLSLAEVADILQYPITLGRRAQLIRRSEQSEAERRRRVYGCRHCQQKASVPSEVDPSTKSDINMAEASSQLNGATSGPDHTQHNARGSHGEAAEGRNEKSKPAQLFKFDGLRSHAKEKHGILWIGDEDFFEQEKTKMYR